MCIVYMELDDVLKQSLKVLEFEKKKIVKIKTLGFKIWRIKFKCDFIKASQINF